MELKRDMMADLIGWKNRTNRKPLLIKGVRQCGKTFLLKQFGREQYANTAYFNFEGNDALAQRFEQNLDPQRIITELGIINRQVIQPEKTLIIFDEIQFSNRALSSLKYFAEELPQYHIISAGSLLGLTLSKPLSFPVGKVDMLTMRPLNFKEYLLASGEEMLVDFVASLSLKEGLSHIIADRLVPYYQRYLITGGMPEVVSSWVESGDLIAVERIQDAILTSYEFDFAKHAPTSDFPKISSIWKSIPDQLAKESGKFVYGRVKTGARAKDLADSLQWLINAGLVYQVVRMTKPAIPLSAYADSSYFKLYLADVGLLRRMARLPASAILAGSSDLQEFKGALTENYVLNELVSSFDEIPYYWKSENIAEVDFVVQSDVDIVPIEVKSSFNLKSRSLQVYRQKYNPRMAIKSSIRALKSVDGLLYLPLYLFWNFPAILSQAMKG